MLSELISNISAIKSHRSAIGASLTAAALICAESSVAQEIQNNGRRNALFEEVIVTAQKKEEAMNDVPIAISAFSGDALEQLGVQDTTDLGNLIPGFSFADSGYNVPIYQLRGVGFNEKSQTASSTVGVYIDEFSLPFPVLTKGANLDLARVEVLKGPQGTLYGRNTTGGAVNYISNKPADEFEAGLTATHARFQTTELEAFVNQPLTDNVAMRLAVKGSRSEQGWQRSITRYGNDTNDTRSPSPSTPGVSDELGEKEKAAARLQLRWDADDDLTFQFALDWWQDKSEPQAGQTIGFSPQNPVTGGLGPSGLHPDVRNYPVLSPDSEDNRAADWPQDIKWGLDNEFLMATARADWDLNDSVTMSLLGQYVDYNSDDKLPSSGLDTTNQHTFQVVETSVYSLELRFSGLTDNGNWVAGLYASQDSVYEFDDVPIATASALFNFSPGDVTPVADFLATFGDQQSDVYAIFGNREWDLTSNLRLTFGARYTEETRKFRGCTRDSDYATSGVGAYALFNALTLAGGVVPGGLPAIPGLPDLPLPPAAGLPALPDIELVNEILDAFLLAGGDLAGAAGPRERGDCITSTPATYAPQPKDGLRLVLEESNLSGRMALDWAPTDNILIYGSLGRGFKSGSFPILSGATAEQYEPVTQERLDALEIGSKAGFFDGLLQINSAIFYYDYQDKQLLASVQDPIFGQLPSLRNAPESRVYGFETDISGSPIDDLYLALSGAYIKTEVLEYSGTDELGNFVDFEGKPFNYAPEVEFSFLANYFFAISDNLDITMGASYNWTDETNASLSGIESFEMDDYSLVGANIGLAERNRQWEISLWGRNITNEFYINNVLNPGDDISRRTGMPATYGITAKYRYP